MTKHINIDPIEEILLKVQNNGIDVVLPTSALEPWDIMDVATAKAKLNQLILEKQIELLKKLIPLNKKLYKHNAIIAVDINNQIAKLKQLRSKE